jgi:hypothetical protein
LTGNRKNNSKTHQKTAQKIAKSQNNSKKVIKNNSLEDLSFTPVTPTKFSPHVTYWPALWISAGIKKLTM